MPGGIREIVPSGVEEEREEGGPRRGHRFEASGVSLDEVAAEAVERLRRVRGEWAEDAVANTVLAVLEERYPEMPTLVRKQLQQELLVDMLGAGPIQRLLDDPEVSDVIVEGPYKVYSVRNGRRVLERGVRFRDERHLKIVIDRMVAAVGRSVTEARPMVDARLPDGSRVHAIIPPVAIDGPYLTIRKFHPNMTPERLIELGTMDERVAGFLRKLIEGRATILVSGPTGSGKTTTLNVLSQWIPEHESIVTIEDSAELQFRHEDLRRLETRRATGEGVGEITIRDLIHEALRMFPDRIIVGEMRGPEAYDFLQAANTGHDGSFSTIHASSARDVLRRLETLVLEAEVLRDLKAVRAHIAASVDFIVHQAPLFDHSIRMLEIVEVTGFDGEEIGTQAVFRFRQTDFRDGKIVGTWEPCLRRSEFRHEEKLALHGVSVEPGWFADG